MVSFSIHKTHTACEIDKLHQNFAMLHFDSMQRDLGPKLKAKSQLLH